MGKTYHNSYQKKKEFDEHVEYSPEYEQKIIKQLKSYKYAPTYSFEKAFENSHNSDYSHTTLSTELSCKDVQRKHSRHPNKKGHSTLTKEFKGTNVGGIKFWRHSFGERHDKSDRMKVWRGYSAGVRRSIMKRNDQKLIEEELNKD